MVQHLETLAPYFGRFVVGNDKFATDNQHSFYSSTVKGRFHTHIGRFATQILAHSHPPTNVCYMRYFVT